MIRRSTLRGVEIEICTTQIRAGKPRKVYQQRYYNMVMCHGPTHFKFTISIAWPSLVSIKRIICAPYHLSRITAHAVNDMVRIRIIYCDRAHAVCPGICLRGVRKMCTISFTAPSKTRSTRQTAVYRADRVIHRIVHRVIHNIVRPVCSALCHVVIIPLAPFQSPHHACHSPRVSLYEFVSSVSCPTFTVLCIILFTIHE